jgi:iron complex transport system permease protein
MSAGAVAGRMSCGRPGFPALLLGGLGLLCVVSLLALSVGAVAIPPADVLRVLLDGLLGRPAESRDAAILLHLRLPRIIMAGLIGMALGLSGAVLQGLFRNPLADPTLIGVSAGATLAAATTIVTAGVLFPLAWQPAMLPIGAFLGGLAVIAFIYRIALVQGRTVVAMLLLAGIAFNAIAMAGTGFIIFIADDNQLRDITFWTLGSVGGARWSTVIWLVPFVLAPLLAMPWLARALDALNLGEREAAHLGVNVERMKRLACLCAALAVGGAVAVSGTIGFVGLVVPHIVRLLIGPQHRYLMPLSALLGAVLLIGADMLARTLVAPADLPIGLLTALIGAPFFLGLLLRLRGRFAL